MATDTLKISAEQLQALKDQFDVILADHADGALKSAARATAGTVTDAAQSALSVAQGAESQAKLDELTADHKTAVDAAKMDSLFQALLNPTPAT